MRRQAGPKWWQLMTNCYRHGLLCCLTQWYCVLAAFHWVKQFACHIVPVFSPLPKLHSQSTANQRRRHTRDDMWHCKYDIWCRMAEGDWVRLPRAARRAAIQESSPREAGKTGLVWGETGEKFVWCAVKYQTGMSRRAKWLNMAQYGAVLHQSEYLGPIQ